jgi:hypothetical protein
MQIVPEKAIPPLMVLRCAGLILRIRIMDWTLEILRVKIPCGVVSAVSTLIPCVMKAPSDSGAGRAPAAKMEAIHTLRSAIEENSRRWLGQAGPFVRNC